MRYPNLSSLAVCGRASPASRNEELSDARHSNRSGPQAGEISPRTRRRRRVAPSARLHRLRLHPRPHRRLGAGACTAKGRVAPKPGGEFQQWSPRWCRQPRTLTTASSAVVISKAEEVMRLIADIYDRPSMDFRNKADRQDVDVLRTPAAKTSRFRNLSVAEASCPMKSSRE